MRALSGQASHSFRHPVIKPLRHKNTHTCQSETFPTGTSFSYTSSWFWRHRRANTSDHYCMLCIPPCSVRLDQSKIWPLRWNIKSMSELNALKNSPKTYAPCEELWGSRPPRSLASVMALASSSSLMILVGPETSLAAKCNGVRPRVGLDTKWW